MKNNEKKKVSSPENARSGDEATEQLTQQAQPEQNPAQSDQMEARTLRPAPSKPPTPPPMVGIGASAGGLEAYRRLLERLPTHTGLAYLFVQHLDPTHPSALPEILARSTQIPVVVAKDGMRVEADHAYVIPPNKTMTLTDGHLRLVPRSKERGLHLPIDAFLCSLAEVPDVSAIGVILSGAGSDGARGIEAVKEAGGITMAQDSASAGYSSMPESAEATGSVDFVLTPEGIADQLALLGRHIKMHGWATAAAETSAGDGDEDLRRIFALLKRRTGADFQHYRRGTVHRRILRRMMVHRQETRGEYLAFLRANQAEVDLLYEDLLIGVTSFFRDPEVFESLKKVGFPEITRGRATGAPTRLWIAGCSGGEEAYSLAIALLEFLGDRVSEAPIQIFGTDLNESAVARARAGLYPESIRKDVSPERLQRFFQAEEGGYRISNTVRELCVFSRQNVISDPPFSHLDLISCRNVMIYLEPVLQNRLFPVFHYALEPNGLLLLGTAESARAASEFFVPLTRRQKIYRRRATSTRPLDFDFVSLAERRAAKSGKSVNSVRPNPPAAASTLPRSHPGDDIESEADRLVTGLFAPPGVLINEQLEILQFRGSTGAYLEHPSGAANLQLLRLVRPELIMPLRSAIRAASTERRRVREGPTIFTGTVPDESAGTRSPNGTRGKGGAQSRNATARHVFVDVIPLRTLPSGPQFFLVLFEEEKQLVVDSSSATGDAASPSGPRTRTGIESRTNRTLRQENEAMKRYLQAVMEEHEAATEELRAANEEIQSANEELQSSNEELETTKEEVQSTNEELTTVNEEMRHRNLELQSLSGDLMNVLASTTIPIIIVGRDMRLRRFTPASERVMKVIPTDVGRPLSDVRLLVPLPNLEQQIRRTVDTLEVVRQEVRGEDDRWWDLTIRPYLTTDRRVEGATLIFSDIDAVKRYGIEADLATRERQGLLEAANLAREDAIKDREIADSANRVKATFLASISHDLRTPLNAIEGYADLVAMGIRGPVTLEQSQDLARIKRSARHLLAIINDILNFAKVEAGTLDLRLVDVAVAPMTDDAEETIASLVTEKSLQFHPPHCRDAAAGEQPELTVRADPEKLQQILLNLLTNSIKFTEPGGSVGIECGIDQDGDGNAMVRITVWDTGLGIPADHLAHIFEPFVQVDRGLTTPPPEGVGLGLAISRDLARAMNGDLTVESVVGRGSRFTITLPRGDAIGAQ